MLPLAPEASASTNSATRAFAPTCAGVAILYHILSGNDSAGFALEGGFEMRNVGDDAGFIFAMVGEFNGGFNFGEHGARLEITVFDEAVDFASGDFVE